MNRRDVFLKTMLALPGRTEADLKAHLEDIVYSSESLVWDEEFPDDAAVIDAASESLMISASVAEWLDATTGIVERFKAAEEQVKDRRVDVLSDDEFLSLWR